MWGGGGKGRVGKDGPLISSASSLGRGQPFPEWRQNREGNENMSIPAGGAERGDGMAAGLSCQQQSDALHRCGERSQDFPNPGAPTGLQKTHPSAHRQTALPRTRETPWEAAHVPGDLPVKAVFVQGGRLYPPTPHTPRPGGCRAGRGRVFFDERFLAGILSSALVQG